MAGLSWFELDVDFHEHPKTVALQVALRNSTAEAYVSRLWAYCYHHATDRFVGLAAPAIVEQAAKWKGRAGHLVTVLLEVGFLERDGGDLVAHGVRDRLGPHIKARRDAAERQRRRRERLVDDERDVTRDERRDVTGMSPVYSNRDKNRDSSEITIGSEKARDPDLRPLASSARAGKGKPVGLAPLGAEVVAAVSAGLGWALRPLRDHAEAEEFERRIAAFGGGAEEAISYFAATCRKRDSRPESVQLLLLMLRDLDPAARRAAGGST
jgi:hypothetical protein